MRVAGDFHTPQCNLFFFHTCAVPFFSSDRSLSFFVLSCGRLERSPLFATNKPWTVTWNKSDVLSFLNLSRSALVKLAMRYARTANTCLRAVQGQSKADSGFEGENSELIQQLLHVQTPRALGGWYLNTLGKPSTNKKKTRS